MDEHDGATPLIQVLRLNGWSHSVCFSSGNVLPYEGSRLVFFLLARLLGFRKKVMKLPLSVDLAVHVNLS